MASDQSNLQNYLDEEDFRKVADTRRSFWTGGFKGFVVGSATGLAGHRVNVMIKRFPKFATRNHLFMAVLAGGGFGMFVGSCVGSMQKQQDLHNVLRKHKVRFTSGFLLQPERTRSFLLNSAIRLEHCVCWF
jgi:hypothetical protein